MVIRDAFRANHKHCCQCSVLSISYLHCCSKMELSKSAPKKEQAVTSSAGQSSSRFGFMRMRISGSRVIAVHIRYTCPSLPTFLFRSVALHVKQNLPQHRLCIYFSPSGYKDVAVETKLRRKKVKVPCVHIHSARSNSATGVQGRFRLLVKGSLIALWGTQDPSFNKGPLRTFTRGRQLA